MKDTRPDTRPHMISLRLSAEELDMFGELVAMHGFESISDLVRSAVARVASIPAPPSLDGDVAEIRSKLVLMDAKLETLSDAIDRCPVRQKSLECSTTNACGYCASCSWERNRGLRA